MRSEGILPLDAAFAVIAHGAGRFTKDMDLADRRLARENVGQVKRVLAVLQDNAARDIADDDVRTHTVVRVADETDLRPAVLAGLCASGRSRTALTIRAAEVIPRVLQL